MTEKLLYLSRADKALNELLQKPANKTATKSLGFALLILLSGVFLQTAAAQDDAALHEENCIACHSAMTGGEGSVLYTRDDRVVTSSDALTKQVNRCQSSLELGWSKTQIDSMQQYLNQSFYKF
jgi:hypothetical protein